MTEISVVVPVFQNRESLHPLIKRITDVLDMMDINAGYELIFVDDGSTDKSYSALRELSNLFVCTFKIVQLSRNFGQVPAISAGLAHASGKAVVVISADLQDPPELIPLMFDEWLHGKDIVIAHRISRRDPLIAQITSKIAYRIARKKYPTMPRGGFDFLLLSARATEAYLKMKGKNRFFQGDIMYLGFKIAFVPYKRSSRDTGKSQWTFSKRMKYFQDLLVTSSNFFPKVATLIGGIITTFSSSFLIVNVLVRLCGRHEIISIQLNPGLAL